MQNQTSRRRVRIAVFPVAGLGTRFLPATKTVPKEMLPIVDKPLIQYAVDEAVEAGCDTLVLSPTATSTRSPIISTRPTSSSRSWRRRARPNSWN